MRRGFGFSLAVGCLIGVAGTMLGGCAANDEPDSRCAGYLGCTGGPVGGGPSQSVGVAPPEPLPPGPPATPVNVVLKGAGCGKPLPADQPKTIPGQSSGFKAFTVMGTGATLAGFQPANVGPRTFWVRVPADYDPQHAYRVVYIGGEYGFDDPATGYPLFNEAMGGSEEAIYVAMAFPTDMVNMNGYDDRGGVASQEWEAFQLFQQVVDDTYCVNNNLIFAVGNHPGGDLANMWGCYFAGDGQRPASDPSTPRMFAPRYHLRGQGSVAAGDPPNNPPCNGPVAALWIQDMGDVASPLEMTKAAIQRVLTMNGCVGSEEAPWHQEVAGLSTCVQYTRCPADYPVVFCLTTGLGHAWQASAAVPAWTMLFDELTPRP